MRCQLRILSWPNADTHLSPFFWRMISLFYESRPYSLTPLVPPISSVLLLLDVGPPFTFQYPANGFGRDFEMLCKNRGRKPIRLCLVQMSYAFHGVRGQLFPRVPSSAPQLLFHSLLLHLPQFEPNQYARRCSKVAVYCAAVCCFGVQISTWSEDNGTPSICSRASLTTPCPSLLHVRSRALVHPRTKIDTPHVRSCILWSEIA